ncbi:DUF429 domain-containing protein [Halothiobacillus sp.]|uniref:DUF429 domain-containing protein n=1 Tax=Halothiobacillus sp. TaxID=1891311 RepID=UPI002629BEA4|nr:DUF429 domain-containing protein [Halothiobacillus sp.]
MSIEKKICLAGIDMAWVSDRNPTAIAIGQIHEQQLLVTAIHTQRYGIAQIIESLESAPDLTGVAIDAPTIITNQGGARACEMALNRVYGRRKAGCHPTNLARFPYADSVALANWLEQEGFEHANPMATRWQIECYPHPALIEIFGLPERHRYKKGTVQERKEGQVALADMLLRLKRSTVLSLQVAADLNYFFDAEHIYHLRGAALKHNEDVLDAIICLYIAGLFACLSSGTLFGDAKAGYIYVPQRLAILEAES